VDAAARAAGVDANRLDRSVFVLAGTLQRVVEHLEAAREALGYPTCRFGRTGSKSSATPPARKLPPNVPVVLPFVQAFGE